MIFVSYVSIEGPTWGWQWQWDSVTVSLFCFHNIQTMPVTVRNDKLWQSSVLTCRRQSWFTVNFVENHPLTNQYRRSYPTGRLVCEKRSGESLMSYSFRKAGVPKKIKAAFGSFWPEFERLVSSFLASNYWILRIQRLMPAVTKVALLILALGFKHSKSHFWALETDTGHFWVSNNGL